MKLLGDKVVYTVFHTDDYYLDHYARASWDIFHFTQTLSAGHNPYHLMKRKHMLKSVGKSSMRIYNYLIYGHKKYKSTPSYLFVYLRAKIKACYNLVFEYLGICGAYCSHDTVMVVFGDGSIRQYILKL
jgi:hypothetical protein